MSVRGVPVQDLPENQGDDVAGVVVNEALRGHAKRAAAVEAPVLEEAPEPAKPAAKGKKAVEVEDVAGAGE